MNATQTQNTHGMTWSNNPSGYGKKDLLDRLCVFSVLAPVSNTVVREEVMRSQSVPYRYIASAGSIIHVMSLRGNTRDYICRHEAAIIDDILYTL